jgi:phytanoyl-CoA hydroxylase
MSILASHQREALREQGFVVVKNFIPVELCERLRYLAQHHLDAAIHPLEYEADLQYPGAPSSRSAAGGLTVRRLLNAYARDPLFREWASSPAVCDWLAAYFGTAAVLSTVHHNCIMTKHPSFGSQTGWYQDVRYWLFSQADLVSVWLALGTETQENGGLFFVPGSHNAVFQPQQFDDKKFFRPDVAANIPWLEKAVCPELQATDVVFFHCRTLHAAKGNSTDKVKLSLVHTYYPQSTTPVPGTRSAPMPGVPLS